MKSRVPSARACGLTCPSQRALACGVTIPLESRVLRLEGGSSPEVKGPRAALTAGDRGHHLMRGGDMAKRTCAVEDCTGPNIARGWCGKHLKAWMKYGDPEHGRKYPRRDTLEATIMDRVKVDRRGCWIWQPPLNDKGYGFLSWRAVLKGAHVWAYELWVGPIPDGLEIDHECRTRSCVNPDHLDAVTHQVNIERGHLRRAMV